MKLIPQTRGGALARFGLGALLVILFTAATTAVAGLMEFKNLAADLSRTPALKHANVVHADPGNPQTILVIGSDHRAGTPWKTANTDTLMLVRLNPNSSTINVLSVPRDLEIHIPRAGGYPGRVNEAYSIGGPNLLIRILRDQVFRGLVVNHIVDINFGGFRALVNAIGCVYSDVDHRYYNNTALTNYSSINIQPGYQKLCGTKALAFVRFRHTDSDLVRTARQQDFIRWAKAQYPQSALISNRDRLLKIFGSYTQTDHDLHTVDGLINLFNLVVFMDGHTIKQIKFPATYTPCAPACYVTASSSALRKAFHLLMTPTQSHPSSPSPASHTSRSRSSHSSRPAVTADTADGRSQARALGNVGFPIYYPKFIASGSNYCYDDTSTCYLEVPSPGSYPHRYTVADRSGHNYRAYRMTLVLDPLLGQYYGVQGMQWQNPPILNNPSQTRTVGGRRLEIYTAGGKITTVAWHTLQGAYWVSNSLTATLSNQQMIAIASSFTRAG